MEWMAGEVLRGVLGGRSKRSTGALRYLTNAGGRGLFSNPQVLLAAAGVAWGIVETLSARTDAAQSPPAPPAAAGPVPQASRATAPPVPPLPAVSSGAAAMTDEARMISLTISAAHADGVVTEHERAAIRDRAAQVGFGQDLTAELAQPRPIAEIVVGVTEPASCATLYVLAFTVLRADEQISGAERIYLARLADLLGLDRSTVETLEREAATRIDALGRES